MNWCGEIVEDRVPKGPVEAGEGVDEIEDKENSCVGVNCNQPVRNIPPVSNSCVGSCGKKNSSDYCIGDEDIDGCLLYLISCHNNEIELLGQSCKKFQNQTQKSPKMQQELLGFLSSSHEFRFGSQNDEYSPNQNLRKALLAIRQYVLTGKLNTFHFFRDYDTNSLKFDRALFNWFSRSKGNEELFLAHEYAVRTKRIQELKAIIDALKVAIQERKGIMLQDG